MQPSRDIDNSKFNSPRKPYEIKKIINNKLLKKMKKSKSTIQIPATPNFSA